jgi:hypothetical protein
MTIMFILIGLCFRSGRVRKSVFFVSTSVLFVPKFLNNKYFLKSTSLCQQYKKAEQSNSNESLIEAYRLMTFAIILISIKSDWSNFTLHEIFFIQRAFRTHYAIFRKSCLCVEFYQTS